METNSSGKLPSTWQEEFGREAVLGLLGCFFSLEAFDYDFQVCSPGQLNLRHHRLGSEEPRLN